MKEAVAMEKNGWGGRLVVCIFSRPKSCPSFSIHASADVVSVDCSGLPAPSARAVRASTATSVHVACAVVLVRTPREACVRRGRRELSARPAGFVLAHVEFASNVQDLLALRAIG